MSQRESKKTFGNVTICDINMTIYKINDIRVKKKKWKSWLQDDKEFPIKTKSNNIWEKNKTIDSNLKKKKKT